MNKRKSTKKDRLFSRTDGINNTKKFITCILSFNGNKYGGGGRTRTCAPEAMTLVSYQLLHAAIFAPTIRPELSAHKYKI